MMTGFYRWLFGGASKRVATIKEVSLSAHTKLLITVEVPQGKKKKESTIALTRSLPDEILVEGDLEAEHLGDIYDALGFMDVVGMLTQISKVKLAREELVPHQNVLFRMGIGLYAGERTKDEVRKALVKGKRTVEILERDLRYMIKDKNAEIAGKQA